MKDRTSVPNPCPITFALDTFGDRWSLLIIRDLVFKGKRHFKEFAASPEGIATNVLASRLTKLEAEGILTKSVDPQNASSFVYRLTRKGEDLIPLLLDMAAWSSTYDPQPEAPDSIIDGAPSHLLDRLQTDRAALIQEIIDSARR